MMRITEIAKLIGATTDQIRYLESKGYVHGGRIMLDKRQVRDYAESEVQKIELIIKYRRQGFEIEAAYRKALDELHRPRLI
jgi:DNA-binding transcriptional MerR regulator